MLVLIIKKVKTQKTRWGLVLNLKVMSNKIVGFNLKP